LGVGKDEPVAAEIGSFVSYPTHRTGVDIPLFALIAGGELVGDVFNMS
tara:strand:+ start:895 stop:1038 length:144 start_codon:yes stop_codon:yes gene_type:complete